MNSNNKKNIYDFEELAKSPYGDVEVSKYLYETGLQNVFNDYQKNVATLSKQKQTELQDAYFIRKMSEQYLGGVASNNEVANVSGELMDIYSSYQKNINEINKNYGDLEFNFASEYEAARQEKLAGLLQSQFQLASAKLDTKVSKHLTNIATGETGGLDNYAYLEKIRSEIGEENYDMIKTQLFSQTNEEIQSGFTNASSLGYYGFKTDENGKRVKITDANEFLDQYKGKISDTVLQKYRDGITAMNEYQNALKLQTISNKYIQQEDGTQVANPHYVGDDYDTLMMTGEKINLATAIAFKDSAGNKFFSIEDNADNDDTYDLTSADLFELFDDKVKAGEIDHNVAVNGDVVVTNGFNNKTQTTELVSYVFNGNTWYRLAQEKPLTESDMKLLFIEAGDNKMTNGNYTIRRNGTKANTITVNGSTYVQQENNYFSSTAENLSSEQKAIIKLFNDVHGGIETSTKTEHFVYYNGKFYMNYKGTIYAMEKDGKSSSVTSGNSSSVDPSDFGLPDKKYVR